MKDISNMSMFAGCTPVSHNFVVDPEFVPSDSEFDRILKEIYSVDEKTGLPKGDLAYYLSPDGNPQVKAWLETHLLKPRSVERGSSIEGVTDDMIAEFSRGSDETPAGYASRLRSLYDAATADIARFKASQNE